MNNVFPVNPARDREQSMNPWKRTPSPTAAARRRARKRIAKSSRRRNR